GGIVQRQRLVDHDARDVDATQAGDEGVRGGSGIGGLGATGRGKKDEESREERADHVLGYTSAGRTKSTKTLNFSSQNVDTPRRRPYDRSQNQGALLLTSADNLTAGVLDLIWSAGPVAKLILAILGIFSIISWALIVEKWWQLRRVRSQT